MTEPLTLSRIQAIHETMVALSTGSASVYSSPLAAWLNAEVELLDQLRGILASAMQLDDHAVIEHAHLQTAKEILEAAIGAKSIALDLLRDSKH